MHQEKKISHLNMIQQVITRMGNNSFLLKICSIGIMIAIYSFAGETFHIALLITIIPLIVFWLLDAYYLTLERKFRALYDDVRLKNEEDIDFKMNFNDIKDMKKIKKYSFINVLISISILPFYLVCIITTLILYFI